MSAVDLNHGYGSDTSDIFDGQHDLRLETLS
jgi:hypothetical protein